MRSIFRFKGTGGHNRRKFVGFYADKEADLIVSLACFSEGITKSEVIRSLIDQWIQRKGGRSYFLKGTANRAFDIFSYRNKNEYPVSEDDFATQMEKELSKGNRTVKLTEKEIKSILEKFHGKVKRANEKKSNQF